MAQPTLNPFPILGTQFNNGMDAIIAAFPGSPTVDDLVDAVYDYVSGLGYLSSPPEIEVRSVAYSAINSFINGQTGNYNGSQWRFINLLTGPAFTSFLTVDSLNDRILDIEDNLPKCGLSVEAQNPLFMTTIIGKTAYSYLFTQIGLGGGSSWSTYFVEALTSATANVPFWVAASMEGALIGAGSTNRGMIAPTTEIVTVQIVSALTAALTITAGKILFKWIPRLNFNNSNNGSLASLPQRSPLHIQNGPALSQVGPAGLDVSIPEDAIIWNHCGGYLGWAWPSCTCSISDGAGGFKCQGGNSVGYTDGKGYQGYYCACGGSAYF